MLLNVFVVLCVAQSYVLLSVLVINVAQSCVARYARYPMCCSVCSSLMLLSVFVILCVAQSYVLLSALVINVVLYVCYSICCSICLISVAQYARYPSLMLLSVFVVLCVAQSCVAQCARSLLLLNVFVILCVAQRVCYLMYYLVCSSLMSLYVLLIPYELLNALGIL